MISSFWRGPAQPVDCVGVARDGDEPFTLGPRHASSREDTDRPRRASKRPKWIFGASAMAPSMSILMIVIEPE
jgi:hypothetical protein